MRISNTPYDDVFRTLLNDCSALIIPVINEVFGENYAGDEEIVFAPNEHFLNREGVKSVMGGKVFEYEAKTIRDEGRLLIHIWQDFSGKNLPKLLYWL